MSIEATLPKHLGQAAAEYMARPSGGDRCAAFGGPGWEEDMPDTRAHVHALDAAVLFDSDESFAQYVLWLAKLLEGRGRPVDRLPAGLRHLAGFVAGELRGPRRQTLLRIVESGVRALREPQRAPAYALEPADDGPDPARLAEALVRGDAAQANALLLDRARDEPLPGVVRRVVRPALARIGWWWLQGRVSVAEEHLATEIAHRAVDGAFTRAGRQPRRQRTILLACVEGNRHALGLRTVADAFDLDGWTAYNLGADVPLATLPGMVAAFRPDVVGLSVSMTRQLPAARAAVRSIRAVQPDGGSRILLGGLASDSLPEACRWVGADLAAPDALRAIEALSS